jgi:hypothetical protein
MSTTVIPERDQETKQRIGDLKASLAVSDEFVEAYRGEDPQAAADEMAYIEQLQEELEELGA